MSHPDEVKYRGVPNQVSRIAANACWQFIEELDRLASELEEVGKLVANARYSPDRIEWQRRLKEAMERLECVPEVVGHLNVLMRVMGEHLPQPHHPDNDPSNWVGGREFDPEFDLSCDGDCGTTGEKKEVARSWFMDPATQLIYCRTCATIHGLITSDG